MNRFFTRSHEGADRPRRLARNLAVVAVFLGVSVASAPYLRPALAQVFSFSGIRVEGNHYVDTATIVAYAGISRGEAVEAGALNDAYQRIMNSGLFEKVAITPQGGTLLIQVVENPFINIINFEGNRRIKSEELSKIIKSQSRRIYSPSVAEADAAAIAELYRAKGRLAATVEPKIIRRDGNRIDLVFEITEGKVVENERIAFVGNRAFSDRRLRQVLQTKQAGLLRAIIQRDTFVPERLEVDKQLLTDFYRARGYIDFQVLDASADFSRERDATFVTFTVREGLPYAIGKVTTVSEVEGVSAEEFEQAQKIRTGQTWSPALIDNNITRMENLALKKGLNFIRIDPRVTRDDRNQRLDIEFAIVRGERIFVERIDIQGNATTLDEVVRRQFRTVEGDPLNAREIRQSAERIRALGYFSDAEVTAEPGSTPDQVVVNVEVEEQPTGSLSFGVSYGVSQGLGGTIAFSESNFLGRGQSLSLAISTAKRNQQSTFSFTEPALLGRDLSFSIGASYLTTDRDYALYQTQRGSFSVGLGFPLGEQSKLSVRYQAARDRIFDYTGDSPIIQRETMAGPDGNGRIWTSSIGYSYEFDNRITGLNPTGGFLFRFGQDFAGLGGDAKYISTTFLAMREQRIWHEDVTLRVIAEGGYLKSLGSYTTRVSDRFTGSDKIRGFEPNGIGPRDGTGLEDGLGGNAFAALRLEAEFPLGLPEEYGLTGGAFFDVGSVWSLDDTAGLAGTVDDSFKPRASIGLSLLWNTPVGPLRFNFSRAIKKESYDKVQNFDLTLQTKF